MLYYSFYCSFFIALAFAWVAISDRAIRRSVSLRWQLVLLIIYGILPLLLAWGGLSLAECFACRAEVIAFDCPTSSWLGEIITWMVFAHWLAIFTIPLAILSLLGILINSLKNKSRTQVNTSRTTSIFYRSRRHKLIAGVCAAIAQRWRLPVLAVRTIAVILTVVIPGIAGLGYLWLWLAYPLEPS